MAAATAAGVFRDIMRIFTARMAATTIGTSADSVRP